MQSLCSSSSSTVWVLWDSNHRLGATTSMDACCRDWGGEGGGGDGMVGFVPTSCSACNHSTGSSHIGP